MSSANQINRRVTLSLQQRLDVIQKLKNGVRDTVLANEYGVKTVTIRRIKRDEPRIRQLSQTSTRKLCNRQRIRKPLQDGLEGRLYSWFLQRRALGDRISNMLLQEKARELHEEFGGPSSFKASNGWLWRFKNRHDINFCDIHGESADSMTAEDFSRNFLRRLVEEDIQLQNVYNMDETGLLWKVLPLRTLFHDSERKVCENKIKNDRITVGVCANATGTHKLPPLLIYKFEKPRALKHCQSTLPVVFKTQGKAWMNPDVFADWLENHFKPAVRKQQVESGNRGKVLLLLDNCAAHKVPSEQQTDDVEIIFLPTSMTSALQPMNQGIISKVKRSFRHRMLRKVLDYPRGVVEFYADYDIKDCIDLVSDSWIDVSQIHIRETMGIITGETVPKEEVQEWLSTCDAAEFDLDDFEDNEEDCIKEGRHPEVEETDRLFAGLILWSLTQPEFVQLQVQVLKDYYDQGYK
ncbi:cytochrome P450 302a1, mitochondrial isoform X3 [Ptiloglossa arizonensis]|uniref:cytochrome P450 302a1, mitochondrial isoform X3 n=1 Tax=Ptiloglossa arizonensis TaxID=3350558 RepID=UPI003FA0740A